MGTAVSKRKNLRNDAISSVAAKEACSCKVCTVQSSQSIWRIPVSRSPREPQRIRSPAVCTLSLGRTPTPPASASTQTPAPPSWPHRPRTRLRPPNPSPPPLRPPSGACPWSAAAQRRAVFSRRGSTPSPGRGHARSAGGAARRGLELEVLKGGRDQAKGPAPCPAHRQPATAAGPCAQPSPWQSSPRATEQRRPAPGVPPPASPSPCRARAAPTTSATGGAGGGGSREDCSPDCVATHSQRSLDLETSPRGLRQAAQEAGEDVQPRIKVANEERDDNANGGSPRENMFSFQTATTTMQAPSVFIPHNPLGLCEELFHPLTECFEVINAGDAGPHGLSAALLRERGGKREQEAAAVMERNFRKHLRMVGSRRVKVQTFADRRAKSFSRSWSDPTPIKPDSLHNSRDSGDLQASSGTLDEVACEDVDWEEERELERAACEGDDFIPPKIMLISSKVPKAEYVPTIIRRDDPSIIPILYDHEHATFDDILEEIEKKLTAYRKGCKIWRMLIFCQGGPGHLYLLKNKVATFAKVEKEEDMISFWRRLSRFMSALNPEPNVIHIMGCYVLGNTNGEKLCQNLKNLMRPYAIEFKSPLELSAQGKEMIEIYFDFRLFRLWKARQHSKLLDYDDLL
ncbi:hypothetical protein SKAU_G00004550 [Synaphobranchus kaupii]|uniref:NMDA receptor synaptonuclear signaling and neuronal migration factor n=1 Tax=Synaphobranchus kaupii TaxID=118154 RepID=A0A9Q1JCQ7_SYNKA|nr:hypothetical protein SKAU_G00004550 [Synaphobranchus kaupii]